MRLFEDGETWATFENVKRTIVNEIEKLSDQKILTCDIDEWIEYYYSKYCANCIELYEESITNELTETKIKKHNEWSRHDSYEPQFIYIDGYKIIYTIPFDGDEVLFKIKPSSMLLRRFEVENIKAPFKDDLGAITMEIYFTKQELLDKENKKAYTDSKFENEFSNYRKMIANVNADATIYNQSLRSYIRSLLEKRKEKASTFALISEQLNIPLQLKAGAPSVAPQPLKRVARKPTAMPADKPIPKEYAISDDDYKNILSIIHSACSSMEATAKTFTKNCEEELRDFIIATLNTHYENKVTGETFRRIGKTDVHVIFDNKAAFIGECKIWHGIKKLGEAIQQLFGYSTWKDTKVALIVFNKEIKDFQSVRNEIQKWITENAKSFSIATPSSWQCILHRPDCNEDMQVNVSVYDLHITD